MGKDFSLASLTSYYAKGCKNKNAGSNGNLTEHVSCQSNNCFIYCLQNCYLSKVLKGVTSVIVGSIM